VYGPGYEHSSNTFLSSSDLKVFLLNWLVKKLNLTKHNVRWSLLVAPRSSKLNFDCEGSSKVIPHLFVSEWKSVLIGKN